MDAQGILQRLREPGALDELAALLVNDSLEQTTDRWISPEVIGELFFGALDGWLQSASAEAVLERTVEAAINRLSADRRKLREVTPEEIGRVLRDLVARPFSPDKRLVLTVMDRAPTRELVRGILLTTVLEFGKRVSAPVAGVARGLGSLARLASETVKSRGGALGSVVGAVSSEVERQLERRAAEFVEAALGGVFGQLADAISDPRRAEDAAELRGAALDGVLELTRAQLARELANLDIPGGARILRRGLREWLKGPDAKARLRALAETSLQDWRGRTLRECLRERGLEEAVTRAASTLVRAQLETVFSTPAFASWLAQVVGG